MYYSSVLTFLMNLAGIPATMEHSSTSFVTTAPAAMIAPSPIVTPGKIVAFEPIQTLFPIFIGAAIRLALFFGSSSDLM